MKKFLTKFLLPFMASMLAVSMVATPLAAMLHVPPAAITLTYIGGVLAYRIYAPVTDYTGIMRQDLALEIWENYIVERFWKDNQFLKFAFSDDDKVLAGKLVHIPNPGALPKVTINRMNYPLSIIKQMDKDIVYMLDEYSTDATAIHEAEKIELSYDKINAVYGNHAGVISETAADHIIIKWLTQIPQTSVKKTTGANTAELASGLTGTRKVVTHLDVKKWDRQFNSDNVSKIGRKAMFTSNMLDELTTSLSEQQWNAFNQYFNAETGVIGRLYNFDILERSNVALAGNVDVAPAVLPIGAAPAAADGEASLFWQQDCVTRALGDVKFFEDLQRADYQADIYSAYLRAGGRRRREDNKGVGMLVQATGV